MSAMPKVLLIGTQDTKSAEVQFIRDSLESLGAKVFHMDPSIRQTLGGDVAITPDQIAAATGKTMPEIRALNHEGKCQAIMIEGAVQCALELHGREGLAGIIAVGGSMGTTLGTSVMRAFPFGLPKVMISTMASGFTRPFVGFKDIVMVNSVADISGLNSITRSVFANGACALVGMAKSYSPIEASGKPLVAVSTLGTTDKCAVRLRKTLEDKGFEVVIFHTLGTGGAALDDIVRDRNVAVVVDLSLVEINDLLHGGLCSAGPDRCKAALEKGVPTIFAPGNIDFLVAGPIADAEARFPGKRYHIHNAALTAVRSEAEELRHVADHMAGLIKQAKGPVSFYVPLLGFSSHDSAEGHLHDPSLPPVFADYLKAAMPAKGEVVELSAHINDPQFADALANQVIAYHTKK
jgi:uncharacterized protein (UPF0261 family)